MASSPVQITVTGAAGQIGYALVHRIASGQLLGPDQPVALRLLEIEPAMKSLNGTIMELVDCAFPLLADVVATTDVKKAFESYNKCRWDYPATEAAKYARGRLALPEMLRQFEEASSGLDKN